MNTSPSLFAPLQIRGVRFRNRIVVSPMCQYSSRDGHADDWHLVHLGSRAVGGAGLVFTEAASVLPEGRISPDDLGIYRDSHIEMLARVFAFIEAHGAIAGVQLAHAGRKASTAAPWNGGRPVEADHGGWRPVLAPSALPFAEGYPVPQALDQAGIDQVVAAFAQAAQRVGQAGGKVVEIHAAHGYLLHQFLSPLSNVRTDRYGGSFENRTRIVREVTAAVRKVWPEQLPLFVRFSATDWVEGGWDIEQSVELARALKPLGVDLIDCSSGGLVPHVRIPVGPGYQVPFAERIRRDSGLLTGAVGLIREPQQAEEILQRGQADMILLARQLLREPYWPHRAARELGVPTPLPRQYARAVE